MPSSLQAQTLCTIMQHEGFSEEIHVHMSGEQFSCLLHPWKTLKIVLGKEKKYTKKAKYENVNYPTNT